MKPHAVHSNLAWVTRFSFATCPQPPRLGGHVREVLRASTATTRRPALTLSLVRQDRQELRPTRVEDAAVQARLGRGAIGQEGAGRVGVGPGFGGAGHARRVQLLVGDHVVVPHEGERGLVRVVQAPAPDPRVQLRHAAGGGPVRLGAPPGALGERREVPLRFGEFVGGLVEEAGTCDVCAVGGGQKVRDTHVDPDDRTRGGQGFGWYVVAGEDGVPAVPLPLHRDRLDPAAYGPVLVDADVTDALEAYAGLWVVGGGVPAAPVAVLGEGHRVEVADALEPGVSRRLTGLDAAEERLECLVQAAQGGLLGGERPAALTLRVERPDLLELGRLVAILDARPGDVPVGVAAFLQGSVVQRAVIPQHLAQRDRLTDRRAQQKLIRTQQNAARPLTRFPRSKQIWSLYRPSLTTQWTPTLRGSGPRIRFPHG